MMDIEDANEKLQDVKMDTEYPLAKIGEVYVDRRDAVEDAPNAQDSRQGIIFHFTRKSGTPMTRWFSMPGTWEPQHDIVALLSYLEWTPEGSEVDLRELEGETVPIHHGDEGWDLDWGVISDADLPEKRFR